jgi:hypothetical protein
MDAHGRWTWHLSKTERPQQPAESSYTREDRVLIIIAAVAMAIFGLVLAIGVLGVIVIGFDLAW